MTPPPGIDRQAFLGHLRQSGLVGDEQFASVASLRPELSRGKAFARLLVERGVLTRYQAERLLAGKKTGFHLGPYRILELLGQGGMGKVYKAQHQTMKRLVALKVLANSILASDRAVELFQHEMRAVAVLQHPNIVAAYDANEVGGRYFLVLEFVDGPNLDQLVRQRGPLPVGLACDYARQAALGLQYAHKLGMVHRDIKPANILVQSRGGESGLVKVSDFGLARLAAPVGAGSAATSATILTRDNSVMGTPDYLSPEQTRDLHKADIRSDLYSLGCSMHFLLTGQVPFPGGNAMDKIIRHATESPRRVAELRPGVPPEVDAIVAVLLSKEPGDRFRTPAELAESLAPFAVGGSPPWAVPPPLGELVPAQAEKSDAELAAVTDAGRPEDTPVAVSPLRGRRREERRLGLAVAIAVTIAFGGMALLVLIGLLSGKDKSRKR